VIRDEAVHDGLRNLRNGRAAVCLKTADHRRLPQISIISVLDDRRSL